MGKLDRLTKIDLIIEKIFNDSGYLTNLYIHKLNKKWFKIIGKQLYSFTKPVKIEKSTLYINCSHQGFITSLQFYKTQIIKNINSNVLNLVEIKDIKFLFNYKNFKRNNQI